MTPLVGWILIVLAFMTVSTGLLYPGYRLARRAYPGSKKLTGLYGLAAAGCAVALWFLLPLLVRALFELRH